MKQEILNLTLQELCDKIKVLGQPAYRAEQLFTGITARKHASFEEITTIPKSLSGILNKTFVICTLTRENRIVSKEDGTEKFLWKLRDGHHVETVLIKAKKRKTLCLSTQVGCRYKCPFCASGANGFIRDLETAEIVNQILCVEREKKTRITNVVFMGMGEPLDNYDNLAKAVRIINDPAGINLGSRKITVSTVGIIPGIKRLKKLGVQVELSVSLHGVNDIIRSELVPVNKKYPLKALIQACKDYVESTGRIITFEYTVFKGKNDSIGDAEELSRISREVNAKVNLIPCSKKGPRDRCYQDVLAAENFEKKLKRNKVKVMLRRSKGTDILAACGQLALRARER